MSEERALKKLSYVLYICEAPQVLRTEILSTASKTVINLICEVVLNIVHKNLDAIDFLEEHKAQCKQIIKRSQSVKKKRELIADQPQHFYKELGEIINRYV
jgi:hypothetical protein